VALFFIFFGLFSIFTGFQGRLWLLLIGWFVYAAVQSSYQQATLQEVLSGVKVKDVMVKGDDMLTLSSTITIEEAVNGYFLRYGHGGFPVFDDGKFFGIVTLKEIKKIPREDWGKVTISPILVPHRRRWELFPEDDVLKALELMIKEDKGRIVVTKNDAVIGLITGNGIARYMQVIGK
jgi:predicted transcriptional regulator